MRPFEDVTLLACVHDDNPSSSRLLRPGDAFTFSFSAGDVGPCGTASVSSPSDAFGVDDWSCAVDGQDVTLTHVGDGVPWAFAEAACTEVRYRSTAGPAVVRHAVHARNPGTHAPPEPRALVIAVSADIGSVGPPGPAGPMGPAGPTGPEGAPGPSPVGVAQSVESTWSVQGPDDASPILVPGLQVMVPVAEGSRLFVVADVPAHGSDLDEFNTCPLATDIDGDSRAVLMLEADGEIVAERISGQFPGGRAGSDGTNSLVWLSPPLAAGDHELRVLVRKFWEPDPDDTPCYGDLDDPEVIARLMAIELRQ
jgi:hypothetical protein